MHIVELSLPLPSMCLPGVEIGQARILPVPQGRVADLSHMSASLIATPAQFVYSCWLAARREAPRVSLLKWRSDSGEKTEIKFHK